MNKKHLYLIFFLQLWIIFGILMITPIKSEEPIQEESYASLKSSASKQCVRVVGEFRVNDYTTGIQNNPVICRLTDDKFAVAWEDDTRDGSSSGVFTCVINATTGEKLTSEVMAHPYASDFQGNPTICATSNDSYAVAWETGDGAGYGIYARIFNATTGNNITNEFRANEAIASDQREPSICCTSGGRLVIVWRSNHRIGTPEIFGRVFNATTGNNVTDEFRPGWGSLSQQPSVCAITYERFVVMWRSFDGIFKIFANEYSAIAGAQISGPKIINDDQDSSKTQPSACSASDTFAVAWGSDNQDGSDSGIYAKAFESFLLSDMTMETQINQHTSLSQEDPSICALSTDHYAVAWESENQDTSGYGVYATVFKAQTGSLVTNEVRVNYNVTNEQRNPSICGLSETEFAVVWESNHKGQYDIYATVFRMRNISPLIGSGDDDDGGSDDKESIFGYNIIAIIAVIGCVAVVLIKKIIRLKGK